MINSETNTRNATVIPAIFPDDTALWDSEM